MSLMVAMLFFVIGFIAGGIVTYIFVIKLSSKVKIQDELTRTKRELANTRRAIDDFFTSSNDLFSVLDKSYAQYTRFMAKSAQKLSSLQVELFESQTEQQPTTNKDKNNDEINLTKEMLAAQNIVTKDEDQDKKVKEEVIEPGIIDDVRIIDAKTNDNKDIDQTDKNNKI